MRGLTIRKLAMLLDGQLQFGPLPPLGGGRDPIGRVVTELGSIRPGDVFFSGARPEGRPADAFLEEAFVRGALGVVAERFVCPWPGRFSITIQDSRRAISQLMDWARQHTGPFAEISQSPCHAVHTPTGDR